VRDEVEETGASVDLIVVADGQQPIGVWSLIQRASKLDISRTEAQKMFKSGEHPVIRGLSQPQAEALKIEFEGLGATVQLAAEGTGS
jgi:ribosomal protein L7/L12